MPHTSIFAAAIAWINQCANTAGETVIVVNVYYDHKYMRKLNQKEKINVLGPLNFMVVPNKWLTLRT